MHLAVCVFAATATNPSSWPHHWLGDGFCDDGTGAHGADFNCDTFRCDDGDCGPPGSCRSVRGANVFELEVDGDWAEGSLENMAEHEFSPLTP